MGALDYGEANQLLHEGEAFREDTDTDTDSGADSGKAKPKTGRRLQTQMAATKSDADAKAIDVDVEVTNTKEKLMRDVVPQLRETMFSDVFRSELNGQGITATGQRAKPNHDHARLHPPAGVRVRCDRDRRASHDGQDHLRQLPQKDSAAAEW